MKFILYIAVMAGAAYLGYLAEPDLRLRLTGKAPDAAANPGATSAVEKLPSGALKISLEDLTSNQLPTHVVLLTEAKVSDPAAGIEMLIKAGNRVKLVSIDGKDVVISPGEGPFRGKVAITGTDLLQQIAANPPLPAAAPLSSLAGESEEPTATPPVPPAPAPAPAPPPAPAPMPEPTPAPIPEATPEPAPTSAPAAPAAAGSSDVVALMQKSIKAAQIKEFTFDQVLDWAAAPDEVVSGETYQTGVASYKAETIFGVKTIQAKALIKDGVLQRWIWPKSGMEIK
jgi:hypothetical protein